MSAANLNDVIDLCRLCVCNTARLPIFSEDQRYKKIEDLMSIAVSE